MPKKFQECHDPLEIEEGTDRSSDEEDNNPTEFEVVIENIPRKSDSVKQRIFEIVLRCEGESINAIIDLGSKRNIVSKWLVDKHIQLSINIDLEELIRGRDSELNQFLGRINTVLLKCKHVNILLEEAYVEKGLPYDLVLGEPWQKKFLKFAEEMSNGTYFIIQNHPDSEYKILRMPRTIQDSESASTEESDEMEFTTYESSIEEDQYDDMPKLKPTDDSL